MPEESTAAIEHSITQDLSALPGANSRQPKTAAPAADFPVVLRGYDKQAVEGYVRQAEDLIDELHAERTPEAAVARALEQVGEEVAGILRRAHETAEQITAQSRSKAEDRLQRAHQEAQEITVSARARLLDLDADTDRIWAERRRIVEDARSLAAELEQLVDLAAERFPASEEAEEEIEQEARQPDPGDGAKAVQDAAEPQSTVLRVSRLRDSGQPPGS